MEMPCSVVAAPFVGLIRQIAESLVVRRWVSEIPAQFLAVYRPKFSKLIMNLRERSHRNFDVLGTAKVLGNVTHFWPSFLINMWQNLATID